MSLSSDLRDIAEACCPRPAVWVVAEANHMQVRPCAPHLSLDCFFNSWSQVKADRDLRYCQGALLEKDGLRYTSHGWALRDSTVIECTLDASHLSFPVTYIGYVFDRERRAERTKDAWGAILSEWEDIGVIHAIRRELGFPVRRQ